MKLKYSFAFILFSVFFSVCFSQITFQRTYGTPISEYIGGGKPTSDGGYIISFTTDSYPAIPAIISRKCNLMKTDSMGNALWTKTFTKPGFTSQGYWVIQTLDGGYLFSILFYKNGNADHTCLIKTDSNGDTLWVKCPYSDPALQNPDSSYTSSSGAMYLTKRDPSGNVLWDKQFPTGTGTSDFNRTSDKGYVVFGTTNDLTEPDFYLVKTDSMGNLQWDKIFELNGSGFGESMAWGTSAGRSITQTQDGGYIMAGGTDAWGAGQYDIMVIKTDSIGNLQWTHTYGGTRTDFFTSIREVRGGVGYILTGLTQGGAESTTQQNSLRTILLRLGASGNIMWSMMYGSVFSNPWNADDLGYNVDVTTGLNNGFVFIGETSSMGSGNSDIWIVKTDANGISGCNEKPALLTTGTPPLVITSNGSEVTIPIMQQTDSVVYIGTYQHIDSVLCSSGGPVGISEQVATLQDEIIIFPNPTSGICRLSLPLSQGEGVAEVFSVLGERILSLPLGKGGDGLLDLSSQSDGIYFVKIEIEQGIVSKKVMVVK